MQCTCDWGKWENCQKAPGTRMTQLCWTRVQALVRKQAACERRDGNFFRDHLQKYNVINNNNNGSVMYESINTRIK